MMIAPRKLNWVCLTMLSVVLFGCGSGEIDDNSQASVTLSTPDLFLRFFNRQSELPAGQYTLVVAPATAGLAGDFSVIVKRNNGSDEEVLTGSWTADSAGPAATPAATCEGSPSNSCFEIDMQDATGATFELNTSIDGVLYLVKGGAIAETVGFADDNGIVTNGVAEKLIFADSSIDTTDYATAYYAAIDPANARDTLQKFRNLHGFDNNSSEVVHVTFRDSKDLGYGRDMYMRSYANTDCGGQVIAFYVRNFSVDIGDGTAYGPVNLEAALSEDLQYHSGSNAIEFSRGLSSAGDTCSPEPMAKFHTYKPDYSSADAPHKRLLRVDLDERGAKAMPQPCISCHGGKLSPLDRFGRMVPVHAEDPVEQIGDIKARLQAFELDTFEYSEWVGNTRADLEEGLRLLNAAVYCSYPGSAGHAACADHGGGVAAQTNDGEWNGDFARDMLLGWYDDKLAQSGATYSEEYVPPGWIPSPGVVPGGADTLFKKVIGPNCFVCHGKRGNNLGSETNAGGDGKDLDFSSWAKFISYAEEIEELVFDEGRMPLGLLNYNNFWDDPEKAELLASFLALEVDNFEEKHVGEDGKIIGPGRVVARAGPDRVTQPNESITLNAQASLFSDSVSWSLVSSPSGSSSSFSSSQSVKTGFSADTDGVYVVNLRASSSETGSSGNDSLTIVVDSGLGYTPKNVSFYNDVTSIMSANCIACHDNDGTGAGIIDGIPMWWVADASQPFTIPATTADSPALGFYEQARMRINFEYIEDSLILKKPSGKHHYGGETAINSGFDTSQAVGNIARVNYDILVNWIAEGAVCGGTETECPLK